MTISPTEMGTAILGFGMALKGLLDYGHKGKTRAGQSDKCGIDHDAMSEAIQGEFADCRKWLRGEMDDLHKAIRSMRGD